MIFISIVQQFLAIIPEMTTLALRTIHARGGETARNFFSPPLSNRRNRPKPAYRRVS